MGLLDRWGSFLAGPPSEVRADGRTRPRPLTAAGARINLRSPALVHTRHPEWQTHAWNYRDEIPELRFAGDFITNALGRLRVYAAENRPRGEEPVPLADGVIPGEITQSPHITPHTRDAAKAAIDRLNLDRHGSSLLARMGENLEFAGECYLLGEPGDEGEQWTIRSVSEVQITQGGARLVEPGQGPVASRELRPEQCELLRLWNPHPRYYDWPDAAVAALLGTLEGMVLLARRGRAHDRSRISSGKALYLPWEFSLTRAGDASEVDEDDDPAMTAIAEAMMAPIRDESDPSAVVPVVVRGPAMLGDRPAADVLTTIDLHGEDPAGLDERYESLVQRLARGISLPPEVVKGIGDTNHWNGAVIDATMVKNHIEPRAERMMDALTAAYLRPALKAMGVPAEQRDRVCLWFDSSELVENPNREQAAKDAHAANVISDAALRETLGFTDEHAPDELEILRRAVSRERLAPASVPLLRTILTGRMPNEQDMAKILGEFTTGGQPRSSGPQVIDAPQGLPDTPGGVRTAPVPAGDGTGATTAAATPARFRVDEQACRRLAEIDRALTDRLVAHAEATVGRAVEKAANRIRGRAQKDPVRAAAFPKGSDPVAIVAEAGRAVQGDVTDEQALEGALDDYAARWQQETEHAATQTATVVAGMAGAAAAAGLAERLAAAARQAWEWLRPRLQRHVTRVLYGDTDAEPVPTTLVRGALTLAGGVPEASPGVDDTGTPVVAPGQPVAPQTGPATGDTTAAAIADAGGEKLGWRWGYFGIARKDPFLPHQRLDGRTFEGFDDPALDAGKNSYWIGPAYHPGDHDGCMCSIEMIWATPDGPSASELRDELQTTESPQARVNRELLAEDDDQHPGRGTLPDGRTHAQRDRATQAELAELRRRHITSRGAS